MLLERESELEFLRQLLTQVAATGRGALAFVSGEAGVGKSALLDSFADGAAGARLLRGCCDPLFTPRPLGPFIEVAESVGDALVGVMQGLPRPYEMTQAIIDELGVASPTICIVEDAHWADEATLDVLRLLARRVRTVAALIVVTYRDDELDRWHPLRRVLGEVGSEAEHLAVSPLSLSAVAEMASPYGVEPVDLYAKTAGNPFFVTEALAGTGWVIPATVRDAVLARMSRVGPVARQLLETVAMIAPHAELWLLERVAADCIDALAECLGCGMLEQGGGDVWFRHEIARQAVEESIDEHRRRVLHRSVLASLAASESGRPDPARLAHHAAGTGDGEAIILFAPAAAKHAARLGAHLEASAHYARALVHADRLALPERAKLFERQAVECFLTVQFTEAVEAQRAALACYLELGDDIKYADALCWLSHLLWQVGSLHEAEEMALRAVELLESLRAPRQLAVACSQLAQLKLAAEDLTGAMEWARRGSDLAETAEDDWTRLQAARIVGWIEFVAGHPGGLERLEACVATAEHNDWAAEAVPTLVVIARTAGRRLMLDVADRYVEAGLERCGTADIDLWRFYLMSWRSQLELARGQWARAERTAEICLTKPCARARAHALVTLGLVRARRGEAGVWVPLDEVWETALPRGELQWLAPVAAARAEAAMLEGRRGAALAAIDQAWEWSLRCQSSWTSSLAYWRWSAGAPVEVSLDLDDPYTLEIAGESLRAAQLWESMGHPYEAARALARTDNETTLRQALTAFQQLGAQPAAAAASRRLRELGAQGLPRGNRPSTRNNAEGLTTRQADVLSLLAQGLRDRDIAEQLFLSERTVHHHVAAILAKLGVASRQDAVTKSARQRFDVRPTTEVTHRVP